MDSIPLMSSSRSSHAINESINITGNNNCAAGGLVCCAHGFSAVPGWDPVTGLGSPNFVKLRDALVALGEFNAPTLAPTIEAGQPTPDPTVSPPVYPTSNPSGSPTIGAGYV